MNKNTKIIKKITLILGHKFLNLKILNLYIINARMCKGLSVEEMKNANMRVNLGYMLLHNRWIKILNNLSPWIYLY